MSYVLCIMSYVLCIMSYVLCIMFYNPDLLTNFSEPHVYTKFYTNFHSDAFRHLLTPSFQGVQSTEIFFSTTVE